MTSLEGFECRRAEQLFAGQLGISPALLFGGPAGALDGIARPGTERLKNRCRGTLELFHGVVQYVARHRRGIL